MTSTATSGGQTGPTQSVSARPAPPRQRAAPPTAAGPTQTRWLLPVILLLVGNFMAVLDVTIVNVAIPAIRRTSAAH